MIRLMSPPDFGQLLKPFVLFELVDAPRSFLGTIPMHPHSGIATVTVITEGNVRFDDPDSGSGVIDYGGVEWVRAGGGVWHGQEMTPGTSARVRGFQLWLALPPELENSPMDSQYIESDQIPILGHARVVLGKYEGVESPVRAFGGVNYLLVTIPATESWMYQPPAGHESLWLAVSSGSPNVPAQVEAGEFAIFEPSEQSISITAGHEDAVFVIGSAAPYPCGLTLGYYSVHTNEDALRIAETNLDEIGKRLRERQAQCPAKPMPLFK
jgi:redox-sensitive bicupin YhaK (pirin superfamily)